MRSGTVGVCKPWPRPRSSIQSAARAASGSSSVIKSPRRMRRQPRLRSGGILCAVAGARSESGR
eukprot:8410746-Alexandrium_andersonii.AAC.1